MNTVLTDEEMHTEFEAWHNKFYGPQDKYNPIGSLERYPEETGLGYIDATVQAQFALFADLHSSGAIEAAVLAKFGEPVAWHHPEEGLSYENHYIGNTPLYAIKKEGA